MLKFLELLLSTTLDEGEVSDILDDYVMEVVNAR